MKLLVMSDLHAERCPFAVPADVTFDVAVLAGDVHSPGRLVAQKLRSPTRIPEKPIVLVAGNHEYYGGVLHEECGLMQRQALCHDINFLDGNQVVIGGVRFLGCTLWTDFMLRISQPVPKTPGLLVSDQEQGLLHSGQYVEDYRRIQIQHQSPHMFGGGAVPLKPADTLLIHQRERQWLLAQLSTPLDGPTVVVTHHAPHRNSLAPKFAAEWYATAFVNELPDEFFKVPVLWVHGHTHTSFDYRVGNCRVVCNPRGYLASDGSFENSAFDPSFVVEIET